MEDVWFSCCGCFYIFIYLRTPRSCAWWGKQDSLTSTSPQDQGAQPDIMATICPCCDTARSIRLTSGVSLHGSLECWMEFIANITVSQSRGKRHWTFFFLLRISLVRYRLKQGTSWASRHARMEAFFWEQRWRRSSGRAVDAESLESLPQRPWVNSGEMIKRLRSAW